jgi:membrane-bound lytic murein transglycosylase B
VRRTAAAVAVLLGLAVLCTVGWLATRPTPTLEPSAVPAPVSYEVPPAQAAPPAPVTSSGVPVVDEAWVATTAARVGLPDAALRAYARASLMAPDGCGIGWTTLAGIGWIESQHGTHDGRTLSDDGHSSSPVIGPALTGAGAYASIAATPAGTALHGDTVWEHAVGPMQFLPTTWESWASDGDGDGALDPFDLDDAAYAAARYLCADGHDLSTASGWAAAIYSYNHAQSYVDSVHAAATAYASR